MTFIPNELWNGIIYDFKIDLERNDIFPKIQSEFKDKVEFDILAISYYKLESYIEHYLDTMEYFAFCNYFHGLSHSMQLCIRDICEFIDNHDDALCLVWNHDKCPTHIKKKISTLFEYYD